MPHSEALFNSRASCSRCGFPQGRRVRLTSWSSCTETLRKFAKAQMGIGLCGKSVQDSTETWTSSPFSRKKAPGGVLFPQQKEGGTAACCLGTMLREKISKKQQFLIKDAVKFCSLLLFLCWCFKCDGPLKLWSNFGKVFAPVCLLIWSSFCSLMYAVCVVRAVKMRLFPSTGLLPWASFSY